MKIRLGRISIAWLVVAGLMYVVAVVLTMRITWAEGGTLERGLRPESDQPFFDLGVFLPEGSAVADGDVIVRYDEKPDSLNGVLFLDYPAGSTPAIALNHLLNPTSCGVSRVGSVTGNPPNGENVTIRTIERTEFEGTLYIITPTPGGEPDDHMVCYIKATSRPDSFTTRSLHLYYWQPDLWRFKDYGPDDYGYQEAVAEASLLHGYQPLERLKFEAPEIPGARNMRFISQLPVSDLERGEAWRIIKPGELLDIVWDDLYSQQQRDILLIVIGTLIGVGVTVMIEGLKPIIEVVFGGQPGKPRRRRRLRPATAQRADEKTAQPAETPPSLNSP